jgi:hypothetical protein
MATDTKPCRVCRELIAADAKRCSHCQAWQSPWASFWFGGNAQSGGNMMLWAVVMVVLMWGLFRYFMFPSGEDFQGHRSDLSCASQSMTFTKDKDREYLAVVGTIRNASGVTWRELYVEARFFNAKGELIDTYSSELRDVIVLPHSDAAFRLTGYAARPRSEYSKVVLSITSAREKSWRDF